VLESALLLHLLEAESLAPDAVRRLRRYLTTQLTTAPPDVLQTAFGRVALGEADVDSDVVRAALSSFDHFSLARKQLMFQTLLAELGAAHFPSDVAAACGAPHQQRWLQLELAALKVMAAHGTGTHDAVTAADRAGLARAVRPGPVWEANHLARLLGLLALRHHPGHRPRVRETLRRVAAELRPDGGLPFITGMDTFATAIAGIGLARTSADRALITRMVDALAAEQHPDGGFGFTVHVTQSDVDDTSYAVEFLRAAAPRRHAAAVTAAENYLLRQQNPDGGFPTFAHGGPSEVAMTAAAVNALAANPACRRATEHALSFVVPHTKPGANVERSWSRNATNAIFRSALACHNLSSHTPAALRTAAAAGRARLVNHLAETQAADGGWGHHAGDESDPISTAYAVIALARSPVHAVALHHALGYLADRQQPDGGYVSKPDQAGPRPLLYNAPALADVCVLLALTEALPGKDLSTVDDSQTTIASPH
jgi:squalene-hopene/tetraprenyl-beta-curcumene cyclase/sporulenol synthase